MNTSDTQEKRMSGLHPDDRIEQVLISVRLGDGRTGTCVVDIAFNERVLALIPECREDLIRHRLWDGLKAAEHAANPKGPRLPPELENL